MTTPWPVTRPATAAERYDHDKHDINLNDPACYRLVTHPPIGDGNPHCGRCSKPWPQPDCHLTLTQWAVARHGGTPSL
jgi:hypothetical protein